MPTTYGRVAERSTSIGTLKTRRRGVTVPLRPPIYAWVAKEAKALPFDGRSRVVTVPPWAPISIYARVAKDAKAVPERNSTLGYSPSLGLHFSGSDVAMLVVPTRL